MGSDKIIVMGPGRCGTSFFIRLLTALGEDTGGYSEIFRQARRQIRRNPNFEWPRVLKGTGTLCVGLNRWVKEQNWKISFVFLCVRDLECTIQSMLEMKRGHGVYKGLSEEEFESRIRVQVPDGYRGARRQIENGGYEFCEVRFPDSALDADYAYSCVVMAFPHVQRRDFNVVWTELSDPDKIHFVEKIE